MNNLRRLVAVPLLAVALTACGSNDTSTDDTEIRSTTATASTTTRPATATTTQPAARATTARPATTVTSPVDVDAVASAVEMVGGDDTMRGYLTALSAAGIGATADELVTIALYTPSMCEMKTSMGMSDEDAATYVPDDLAANGITVTPAQAEALIWSANVHLC